MHHLSETAFPTVRDEMERKAEDYLLNHALERIDDPMPSVAGLACHLQTSLKVVTIWRNRQGDNYKKFAQLVDEVETKQARLMLNSLFRGEPALRNTVGKDILANALAGQRPLPKKPPAQTPDAKPPAAPAEAKKPDNVTPLSSAQQYANRFRE